MTPSDPQGQEQHHEARGCDYGQNTRWFAATALGVLLFLMGVALKGLSEERAEVIRIERERLIDRGESGRIDERLKAVEQKLDRVLVMLERS
jgi:hypothetical protein